MISTTEMWAVPGSLTLVARDPELSVLTERTCLLELFLSESDGTAASISVIFDGVESYKATSRKGVSSEMDDACCGKIARIENSSWLEEINLTLDDGASEGKPLGHFAVSVRSGPCFEFICSGFEVRSR